MSDHDTSSNWTYPLSLHDALPIFLKRLAYAGTAHPGTIDGQSTTITDGKPQLRAQFAQQGEITDAITAKPERSEEHTSELQSRGHLVCRLLLEKKNSLILRANARI